MSLAGSDFIGSPTKTVQPPVALLVGCSSAVAASLLLFAVFHRVGADQLVHFLGYLLAGILSPVLGILFRHVDRQRKQSGFDYRRNQLLQRILTATLFAGVLVAMAHAFLFAADRTLG